MKFPKITCLLVSILTFATVHSIQARTVHMYDGDSLEIPDDWEFSRSSPTAQGQPGSLFSAVSKDGCGLRLDSTGISQGSAKFNVDAKSFDEYIEYVLKASKVKVLSDKDSIENKVAGFKAIEKDYVFELENTAHKTKVVQFNSNHHLYNATIMAPTAEDEHNCIKAGSDILNTIQSKQN